MIWRITLERKKTLNANQAERSKVDYAEGSTADEAIKRVLSFPRNHAFVAVAARRT